MCLSKRFTKGTKTSLSSMTVQTLLLKTPLALSIWNIFHLGQGHALHIVISQTAQHVWVVSKLYSPLNRCVQRETEKFCLKQQNETGANSSDLDNNIFLLYVAGCYSLRLTSRALQICLQKQIPSLHMRGTFPVYTCQAGSHRLLAITKKKIIKLLCFRKVVCMSQVSISTSFILWTKF